MKSTRFILKLTSLFLFSILLISCDKDKSDIEIPAPPDEESFVMNFNDFNNKKTSSITFINKATSLIYIGVWNSILALNMAIPVAAFKGTISQEVQIIEDNHWMWEYEMTILMIKLNAQLHAFYENDKIIWEMRISQENGYQDFVWFTGESNVDQTAGNWTLYKSPDNPQAYLNINWEKSEEDPIAFIRYENVLNDDPNKGAYIIYGANDNPEIDRYYNIVGVETNNYAKIEWNYTQKNGRIAAPNTFKDELWHCWDIAGADISCD